MDNTEDIRRDMVVTVAAAVESPSPDLERARLETSHGKGNVWNTNELSEVFEVIGFMAPFCVVRRKSDGVKGSVMFQHSPRFYFGFKAN